jgi:hypothetical protein
VLAQSCTKGPSGSNGEDDPLHFIDNNDTTYPVITIVKPVVNQVYNNGNAIIVEGSVSDNGLYQGVIKITADASGTVVKQQAYEIHGQPGYNFNISHTATAAGDFTVSVEFEDHGLNKTVKTVKIKVNP